MRFIKAAFVLLIAFLIIFVFVHLEKQTKNAFNFSDLYTKRHAYVDSIGNKINHVISGRSVIFFLSPIFKNDISFFLEFEAQWGGRKDINVIVITDDTDGIAAILKSINIFDPNYLVLDNRKDSASFLHNTEPGVLYFLCDGIGNILSNDVHNIVYRNYSHVKFERFINNYTPSSLGEMLPVGNNINDIEWLQGITRHIINFDINKNIVIVFLRVFCDSCPEGSLLRLLEKEFKENNRETLLILSDTFSDSDIARFIKDYDIDFPVVRADYYMNSYWENQSTKYYLNELNGFVIEISNKGDILRTADSLSGNYREIFGSRGRGVTE